MDLVRWYIWRHGCGNRPVREFSILHSYSCYRKLSMSQNSCRSVTPGLKKNSDEQLGRLGSGHPFDFLQTGEYRPAADGMEIVSSISQFL